MEIVFKVTNQKIARIDTNEIVGDSVNYLRAKFVFITDEWQGIKTAIFTSKGMPIKQILDENDECDVPWEVLRDSSFSVSVFCGNLITANLIIVPVRKSGYVGLDKSHQPTPDIYIQLLEKMENLQKGEKGDEGASAYEVAVASGFTGTEAEWLSSLKGADGKDGANGSDGKSAYEVAVANGFNGTEAEWLESLVGENVADEVISAKVNDYLAEQGMSSLKATIDNTFTSNTTYESVDFEVSDTGFYKKDGELVGDAGYINTTVSVTSGEEYKVTGMNYMNLKTCVYLDENANVIGYYPEQEENSFESITLEIVVPNGASIMLVSSHKNFPIQIQKIKRLYKLNEVEELASQVQNLSKLEVEVGDKIDIVLVEDLISGYLRSNGTFVDNSGFHTDYVDFTQYRYLYVNTTKQYLTRCVAVYDSNKNFLAILDESNADSSTLIKMENEIFNTSDILKNFPSAKYMVVGSYPATSTFKFYARDKIVIEKAMEKQKEDILNGCLTSNVLQGKKWVACGDSFTQGDFTGYVDANGNEKTASDAYDSDWGMYKTYPWWIAKRNNMTLVNEAKCGSDFTNIDGASNPFSVTRYTEVATDADYITLMFGLNEYNLTDEQIGTSTDTDNTTLWGAYNVVFEYFLTNIPYAKIGVILADAWMTTTYSNIVKEICDYWGIPYLDLKADNIPMGIGGKYSTVSSKAKSLRDSAFKVSSDNSHPNLKAHEYRSTIIENWLRSL